MTRGRKTNSNACARHCATCINVHMHTEIVGSRRQHVPHHCKLDHDMYSTHECFDCETVQPYRNCAECGTRTRDNAIYKGRYLCRSCLCGDYKPSYKPESASALYGMQQWAPGNDIGTAALDRALDRAIVRMGIPTEDFTTEGVK